ncbi:MAG TPA: GDSL-type esterase/lipase family protein [Gaiellaceae bacterium]|nr:GDSL-type esterase/lipase family protein [Gaiellaceae bacterium]
MRFRAFAWRFSAALLAAGALTLAAASVAGAALPSRMAALGDSLSRGYASSGVPGSGDNLTASWTTGTDSTVNSHYARLLALNPAISGHASLYATNGSKMAATASQADSAIAQAAEYVTIMSGTNDVCTTTVAQMTAVTNFKNQLTSTLTKLTTSLPNAKILVASIPNWYGIWQTFQSDASALSAWSTWNNRCPDLLGATATQADRDAVRQRIIDLNTAEAQACAAFPACTYDGGAVYNLAFARTDLSYDYFHPSITGQAMVALATWNVGPYAPPVNTGLPSVSGTAREGEHLTASTGTWSGNPSSYAYKWRRCDGGGGGCADIPGATASSYTPVTADVGSTLRVAVTATNLGGSASATSNPTQTVAGALPTGFGSVVIDAGCTACAVTRVDDDGLWASIGGGADDIDTAYAVMDFGGAGGLSGRTFVRDLIGLAQGEHLTKNLDVLEVRDVSDQLVYEVYLDSSRTIRLYSPPGGLRATQLNANSGAVVPNDGTSTTRLEVSAQASGSIVVRVDGVDRISVNLRNATSGDQRYLRAGIDHYDSTSANDPVAVLHTDVLVTQADWPGAPGPPANTGLPVIFGPAQDGRTLSASTGSWSGLPTSYTYQWRRCNFAGASCVDLAGQTSSAYHATSADIGSTLRVAVTATNAQGTGTATSGATAGVVQAVPPGFTSTFFDPGCDDCAVTPVPNGLRAAIGGGSDDVDTAYAVLDFGGAGGVPARTFIRDVLTLPSGQTVKKNLAVFDMRDVSDQLVYELYLDANRTLKLFSPAGGLRGTALNANLGFVVPNDGSSIVIEVSALASDSVTVRVDGVDRYTLGLRGATSGNQRYLHAGIDHYDSASTAEPVAVLHTYVAVAQSDWLGAP